MAAPNHKAMDTANVANEIFFNSGLNRSGFSFIKLNFKCETKTAAGIKTTRSESKFKCKNKNMMAVQPVNKRKGW